MLALARYFTGPWPTSIHLITFECFFFLKKSSLVRSEIHWNSQISNPLQVSIRASVGQRVICFLPPTEHSFSSEIKFSMGLRLLFFFLSEKYLVCFSWHFFFWLHLSLSLEKNTETCFDGTWNQWERKKKITPLVQIQICLLHNQTQGGVLRNT